MHRTLYRREGPREGPACRLAAVGDLMLSGEVARRHRPDLGPVGMFDEVAPTLRSGDIVFGNLETPLCSPGVERVMFRGDPAMAPVLASAGFDVLSLANNHILEYGPEGLQSSIDLLSRNGIAVLGAGPGREAAGRPVIMERHGLRVGFLGFGRTLQAQKDPGVPGFVEWDEEAAVRAIRRLRNTVDVVIVSIHIGFMWIDYPNPDFKRAADRLLGEGAHVVLMHHAHVLQGYAAADGRLAVYNLGNFIADIYEGETGVTPVPERQVESAVFLIDLDRRGVVEMSVVPIAITPELTVKVAPDEHARQIIERLERIAREIASGEYLGAFARQRAELNTGNILAWLVVHLRKGHWRELATNILRARPAHVGMLARFAGRKLETLWKRH
jgi:poly-gamma-glutamate capsule biosynthesis protein CapA/YwtB (metallophosphatase superfamily)